MTPVSNERVSKEARQVYADAAWWREAGDVIGLGLNGFTFRNEAQFTDVNGRTVILTKAVAEALRALRSLSTLNGAKP